jgi:hypothetical protein
MQHLFCLDDPSSHLLSGFHVTILVSVIRLTEHDFLDAVGMIFICQIKLLIEQIFHYIFDIFLIYIENFITRCQEFSHGLILKCCTLLIYANFSTPTFSLETQ